MALQVGFVTPELFEQEDIIFLFVPVDPTAETTGLDAALLGHRPEDSQCFVKLFGRDHHPKSCENHLLIDLPSGPKSGLVPNFQ